MTSFPETVSVMDAFHQSGMRVIHERIEIIDMNHHVVLRVNGNESISDIISQFDGTFISLILTLSAVPVHDEVYGMIYGRKHKGKQEHSNEHRKLGETKFLIESFRKDEHTKEIKVDKGDHL